MLIGVLTGDELVLEGLIQPVNTLRHAGCTAGDSVRLTARTSANGHLRWLNARLWSSACPECGVFEFTAARPYRYQGRRRV